MERDLDLWVPAIRKGRTTRRGLFRGALVLVGGLSVALLDACAPAPAQPTPAPTKPAAPAQPTPAPPSASPTAAPAAKASPAPTGVVKIGAVAPLTGSIAKMGQEVANSVKLAAEHWNAKGGVLGSRIEVVEGDDQGNPQQGVTVAEKLAADPAILGVVYGITSVTCIPASEVFEKVDLVMVSPAAPMCESPTDV